MARKVKGHIRRGKKGVARVKFHLRKGGARKGRKGGRKHALKIRRK